MRLKDLACIGEQQNSKRRVADVVDGVDDIVANGRRGELEPVADAEGVRGFESAANAWRDRRGKKFSVHRLEDPAVYFFGWR